MLKKLATLNNLLLLIIVCAPLYLLRLNIFGVPTNIFELLMLLGIIATITLKKELFRANLAGLPKIPLLGILLILLGLLISIFFNDNKLISFGIFKGWFIVPLLFSFIVYVTLNSKLETEKIFGGIYLSVIIVGIIGMTYKLLGIVTYDGRLAAFYLSPNHLAMYLAPGIFFGLFFWIKAVSQKHFSTKFFFNTFFLLIIFASLYYTYSYGAWLAALVALFATITATTLLRKYLVKIIIVFFIVLTFLIGSQVNTEKFSSIKNISERSSLSSRETIWKVSLLLIKENPLAGIGPGNFQQAYLAEQSKFPPFLEWAVPQPHNIFLAFWLQAGLFGFVGFLLLIIFIFQKLKELFNNKKDAALAAPLVGFFLYTLFHGLIDTTFWKNDLSFLFWLCLFLLISLRKNKTLKENL